MTISRPFRVIATNWNKFSGILSAMRSNSPPPGGRVTVEFRVFPPGFVQTCVADTGCGIDPFHLPNVFEEFSEVPSAMPASQGDQLGLCITKTLVTRHHGQIWAESKPEAGSRFYFTLPIAGLDHA